MTFVIVCAIVYVLGMSLACLLNIQSSFFFLFLSILFLSGALLLFWSRRAVELQEKSWSEIFEDEDAVPGVSIVFLLIAILFFGIFRYVYALYPIPPNHLHRVMPTDNPNIEWRVVGTVIEEPNSKEGYLEVIVKPELIQEVPRKRKTTGSKSKTSNKSRSDSNKVTSEPPATDVDELPPPEIKVGGGNILVKVFEESDAFNKIHFNQKIEIIAKFSTPSSKRNPGALDYQKTLINRGIFRTARITARSGKIYFIAEGNLRSWWYRLALYLRAELLKVIKQTMPYPESAFLGGVLLGLKGGVPAIITKEFRMTGVSHVLAVSGLHVTIIAALFYGLFSIFRVPIKIFAPIIVFFLFTFALIVGWPASAVRAALMNSIFILSRAFLKERGFRHTVIWGLSIAAIYILTMSPLQLTEPSFTLSFMAIYALAMFSEPSENLLKQCLRGGGLTFFVTMIILFYLVISIKRDLITEELFFPAVFIFVILVFWISKKISDFSEFQSFSFEMLPAWLRTFAASQLGIFLGMMGPLSAFYFGSISLAAPLANIIAIPLIGVIVQLGLIAGILGAFIPIIGIYLALLVNAANFIAIKFFLGMAHFFAVLIPFPRLSQPGLGLILLYYLVLHLFFYWDVIKNYFVAISSSVIEIWKEEPEYKFPLALTAGIIFGIIFYLGIFGLSRAKVVPELRVTVLDVGYGTSILVEKSKKYLLIDAGMRDELTGFDVGEYVIEPALSEKFVPSLNAVILSSPLPENISGLFRILENYKVKHLYAGFKIPTDGNQLSFNEYIRVVSLGDRKVDDIVKGNGILTSPPSFYWEQAFTAYNKLINCINQYNLNVSTIKAGDVIAEFEDNIEIIEPEYIRSRINPYFNGVVLKIRNRQHQIAYCPARVLTWNKLKGENLEALVVNGIPASLDDFENFCNFNKPKNVVISFRKPSGWLMENFYLGKILEGVSVTFGKRIKDFGLPIFRTDKNGAVEINFYKNRVEVRPYINEGASELL